MSTSDRHVHTFSQSAPALLWKVLSKTDERQTSGLLDVLLKVWSLRQVTVQLLNTDLKSFSLNK